MPIDEGGKKREKGSPGRLRMFPLRLPEINIIPAAYAQAHPESTQRAYLCRISPEFSRRSILKMTKSTAELAKLGFLGRSCTISHAPKGALKTCPGLISRTARKSAICVRFIYRLTIDDRIVDDFSVQ